MSGEFDSRKYSHPTKFEQRPWILVKLNFREFCDSTLSGLHTFDKIVLSLSYKRGQNPNAEFLRQWSFKQFLWPSLRTHLLQQMKPRNLGNIYTTGKNFRDTLQCATWHWNYPVIFTCWWRSLLGATSAWSFYNQAAQCKVTK